MRCFFLNHLKFFCLFCLVSLVTSGCKSEDPNPELLDPIYKNLLELTNQSKAAYEAESKKLEDALTNLTTLEPISSERKMALKEIAGIKAKVTRLSQNYEYLKIRSEHRRVVTRREYRIAFARNQPWPDPSEYSAYLTNQRLRASPRSWDVRVPKLVDRLPSSQPKAKKEEKK